MENSTKALLLLALFMLVSAYFLINLKRQEKAYDEIEKNENSYRTECERLGISFHLAINDREPTPGTSDFTVNFKGPRIDAELMPLQALYFFKSMRKGNPDVAFLEKKSYWRLSQLSS